MECIQREIVSARHIPDSVLIIGFPLVSRPHPTEPFSEHLPGVGCELERLSNVP
jgi:hypothetical protein